MGKGKSKAGTILEHSISFFKSFQYYIEVIYISTFNSKNEELISKMQVKTRCF